MDRLDAKELMEKDFVESLRILIPILSQEYRVDFECSNRLESCFLLIFGLDQPKEELLKYLILKLLVRTIRLLNPSDVQLLFMNSNQLNIITTIQKSFEKILFHCSERVGFLGCKLHQVWIDTLVQACCATGTFHFVVVYTKQTIKSLKKKMTFTYLQVWVIN
jgi:hypothetical protein